MNKIPVPPSELYWASLCPNAIYLIEPKVHQSFVSNFGRCHHWQIRLYDFSNSSGRLLFNKNTRNPHLLVDM